MHHQDVDYFDFMNIGQVTARVDYFIPHLEPARPWKVVSVAENDELIFGIQGGEQCRGFVQEMLDKLVTVVHQFLEKPEVELESVIRLADIAKDIEQKNLAE